MMTVPAPTTLDVLKALASDMRFEMVRILAHGEHCVCDLEGILLLPQSKMSYHLAALKVAGLVSSEQRGKNSYYRLERGPLYSLGSDLLQALLTPDPVLTQRINSVC